MLQEIPLLGTIVEPFLVALVALAVQLLVMAALEEMIQMVVAAQQQIRQE